MRIENEPMLDAVLRKLDETKGEWREVSRNSGVPYSTLTKVAQRLRKAPSITTVQTLHDYFTRRPDAHSMPGDAPPAN